MKVLIVTDSFKESMTSQEASEVISGVFRRTLKDSEPIEAPIADGGEGTINALVIATNGKIVKVYTFDPLMRKIESFYGVLGDGTTAVVEVAAASGLELLKKDERDPSIANSYGTGVIISELIKAGFRKIIVGLGGSAVNDCGAGILAALGTRLVGENNEMIPPQGRFLHKVADIDLKPLAEIIKDVEILVACDVSNPLCGPNGASLVYGPQKGASREMVNMLDENLFHFGSLLGKKTGKNIIDFPGSGAAGGIGAVMYGPLHATMKKGFDLISDAIQLEEKVKVADLIITGEGKTDYQTLSGKAPFGVCQLAKKYNKPVIVFCGVKGEGAEKLLEAGATEIISISKPSLTIQENIRDGKINLAFAVENYIKKKL